MRWFGATIFNRMGRAPARATLAAVAIGCLIVLSPPVRAVDCNSVGPDAFLAKVLDSFQWGTVGDITGYSFGTVTCNLGNQPVPWVGNTNQHPIITTNLYRLRNGQFVQIGMSWAKHTYFAQANSDCCTCINPGTGALLGIGCSDAYNSQVNGNQEGGPNSGGLGPRSDINPFTVAFTWPYTTKGMTGDAIYKRLQVHNNDLDPAVNSGAKYFGEAMIITASENGTANQGNNFAYVPVTVGAFSNGGWALNFSSNSSINQPAIYAWKNAINSVEINVVPVPGDGVFYLGSNAVNNGNGTWHYEYALFNFNSDRAAQSFAIPLPAGVAVTNVGFHDPEYHSGEIYSGADWDVSIDNNQIAWSGQTFVESQTANAVRWGTLYNFSFDANFPPTQGLANITLFKPGSPTQVQGAVTVPGVQTNGECSQAVSIGMGPTSISNAAASTSAPGVPCAPTSSRPIWFKFTSSFTGRLRVDTCTDTGFDTALAVYDGCACDSSPLLACNDQSCGDGSRVTVNVTAGHCYLIQVAAINGAVGNATLRLSCPDRTNAACADQFIDPPLDRSRFGFSLSAAGGSTGGIADGLVIGAFADKANGPNAGRAFLARGTPFGPPLGIAGSAGEQFGRSVGGGRDLNGDGMDDIVVGAPYSDQNGANAGKVYALSGIDGSLLWSAVGQSSNDRFGWSVACIGDLNNDGFADVLVGAPWNDVNGSNSGRVYAYSGKDGSILFRLNGRSSGDRFGFAIAAIGDLDDDGVDDFAIGAPGQDAGGAESGRVYIYSGDNHATLQTIGGSNAGDQFGSAIAGTTYFRSGAQRTSILVGAPNHNTSGSNSGQARAFFRNHNSSSCSPWVCEQFSFGGQAAGDLFGSAVAVGNVMGNSTPDFLIGAHAADFNGSGSGAVYLYNGQNGAFVRRTVGEATGDDFGRSITVVGDLNADGVDDWVAGAPTNDASGVNAGRAYVFLSRVGTPSLKSLATPAGFRWNNEPSTEDVQNVADVNGDGVVDANDMIMVLNQWGSCGAQDSCDSDIAPQPAGDGDVNSLDLVSVISRWGN